jgi:tetratricopeptide (TPR) repeat protein
MHPLPLTKATPVSTHQIASYRVVILTDCQGIGVVQYAHAALVYSQDSQRPIFAVASEVNRMAKVIGGGSHFLCTYDDRHSNYGSDDDWADLKIFTDEALHLISERFVGTRNDVLKTPEERLLYRHMTKYQEALKTLDPKTDAGTYALTQLKLGETYYKLSTSEYGNSEYIVQSVAAYQAALRFLSPDTRPDAYIDALDKIATNYLNLSMHSDKQEDRLKARDAFQAAITGLTTPAMTQYLQSNKNYIVGRLHDELGNVYKMLGEMPTAIDEWRLAQQVYQTYGRDKMVEYTAKKIAKAQTGT